MVVGELIVLREQLSSLDTVKHVHESITDRHFLLAERALLCTEGGSTKDDEDVERSFHQLFKDLDRVHEAFRMTDDMDPVSFT